MKRPPRVRERLGHLQKGGQRPKLLLPLEQGFPLGGEKPYMGDTRWGANSSELYSLLWENNQLKMLVAEIVIELGTRRHCP